MLLGFLMKHSQNTQAQIQSARLIAANAQWALVGALAVSVHTEPRTTGDIDVAIAVRDVRGQEELINSLLARGYRNRQTLMPLAPTHRLGDRLEVRGNASAPLAVDLL